jgi:hypothetical protein
MNPRILVPTLFVALLALSGCNPFDNDYNSPDPMTLGYHLHTVVLYLHTVNADRDTIGVQSISLPYVSFYGDREEDGRLSRDNATMGGATTESYFMSPDTTVRQCSTSINHYVPYERRYGGDTTRYAQLDRYGTWSLYMHFGSGKVVLDDGESASVYVRAFKGVPDTVRSNGVLEFDVTTDMDGLLTRDGASRFNVNIDHVTITQR